ncbi:MAG: hypothetical protein N3E51_01100 [Candidatus Micrarchaeota archaeon]|nr:hypothetical protein [Candidatus Micrarchaeota archaeon]
MAEEDNKPLIAGVLSFLVPGLGHFLINKNQKKAAAMFVIWVALFFIGWITTLFLINLLWSLFCGYDAYMEAQGKPIWKF